MHERLQERWYSKILVRNLDNEVFWYDHYFWNRSSGLRQALRDNYQEIGRIKAVASSDVVPITNYGLAEISILVPKAR
jgi:hypothetical protein